MTALDNVTSITVDGLYSRIYPSAYPAAFYKQIGSINLPALYLHKDKITNLWVIANSHWFEKQAWPDNKTETDYQIYFKSTVSDKGIECPSEITKWKVASTGVLSPGMVVAADNTETTR